MTSKKGAVLSLTFVNFSITIPIRFLVKYASAFQFTQDIYVSKNASHFNNYVLKQRAQLNQFSNLNEQTSNLPIYFCSAY